MLEPMLSRRVQPLAGWSIVVVFALIGAVLFITVWTTRASILDASAAVRCGQADAIEQAVRADLADLIPKNLDALPTAAELEAIVEDRSDEGLRYLAMVEGREQLIVVAAAGTPIGSGGANILSATLVPA